MVRVREPELKFWTDEGIMSRAPKDAQPFFQLAQAAAKAYEKKLDPFA